MPPVIAAIAPIALNLAIGVGVSLVASLFAPKIEPRVQTVTTRRGLSFEMEVGEATAVSAILGLGRAAGQLVYINEFGSDNEFVQFVIKIGHGWHDGLEHFLVDEKPVTLSGSNGDPRGRSVDAFTRSGVPYLWVKTYTGAPGQAADPELVAQANPPERWTAAHKMTGCAYMVITCRYDADFYGSTVPRFGSVWRGLRLLDWRVPGAVWGDQSTYVFTKNPAVIRYNFRRGIWVNGVRVLGQGFPSSANDLAGYTAAANRCDELFYEPVSGKTFPIFEFGRQVSDDEEKLAVLQDLADAYCGSSFKRGGADVPLPAQQLVSVMTLTDGDRLSGQPVRTDRKGSVSSKRTMFHGQFVSADVAWGLAPFVPRIDDTLESLIGGRRAIALDQPYEHLQERAQLRADIALRRQLYPATRVETFTPKAMVLEPGDPLVRDCEWGQMLMVVEKVSRLPDMTGVTITMTEWNNAVVPASGDSFVVLPDGPGAGQADADRTIAVSGLAVVPYSREGGGAVHPFGRASWTQITDTNVDQVMIRVWPVDGTEADDKEDFFADARLQAGKIFGPLQPLTEYWYKAIPIRRDGRLCVWTNAAKFTTGAETVPAEVADGSVGVEKLNQELKNTYGLITTDQLGSLPDRLAQLEQDIADLASGVGNVSDTSRREVKLLKAQSGGNSAAVIEERVARVDADAANASLILETIANLGNAVADAFLRFDVLATDNLTFADIAVMGRIGKDGQVIESGMRIHLEVVDGLLTSQLALLAQKVVITDGVHSAEAFRFDPANGRLVLKELAMERITSIDLTSLVIDGVNPEITFIGGG
ncbi:MAG TPA: hypothetical protein VL147_18530 [Devosia sp.]|nr:hypothetical protein [Devosia sp.]